jgi:hypothetical protein
MWALQIDERQPDGSAHRDAPHVIFGIHVAANDPVRRIGLEAVQWSVRSPQEGMRVGHLLDATLYPAPLSCPAPFQPLADRRRGAVWPVNVAVERAGADAWNTTRIGPT